MELIITVTKGIIAVVGAEVVALVVGGVMVVPPEVIGGGGEVELEGVTGDNIEEVRRGMADIVELVGLNLIWSKQF